MNEKKLFLRYERANFRVLAWLSLAGLLLSGLGLWFLTLPEWNTWGIAIISISVSSIFLYPILRLALRPLIFEIDWGEGTVSFNENRALNAPVRTKKTPKIVPMGAFKEIRRVVTQVTYGEETSLSASFYNPKKKEEIDFEFFIGDGKTASLLQADLASMASLYAKNAWNEALALASANSPQNASRDEAPARANKTSKKRAKR